MRTQLLWVSILALSCRKVTPDNEAPSALIEAPVAGQDFDFAESVGFVGTVSDVEDAPETLIVGWSSDVDGSLSDANADADGMTAFSTANLSSGEHVVTLSVTDSAGASFTASLAISVADPADGAPTIVIDLPGPTDEGRGDQPSTLEATVSDAEDAPEDLLVDIESDKDGPLCSPFPDSSGVASCEEVLSVGKHTLTYTVSDSAMNFASATIEYVVVDPDDLDDDGDGVSESGGDCDDADKLVFPGATELANGVDDDCDDKIDDGTSAFDDDGDGVSEAAGDCDDADKTIHPGATEVIDGIDQDCDTVIDNDTTAFDDDGDGLSEDGGDCDDNAQTVFPGSPEQPDGVDQDCDGTIDEGTPTYDDDGDCFCAGSACFDTSNVGCTTLAIGDCDDADGSRNPSEVELIGDEVDQDCDAQETCFADGDNDKARHATGTVTSSDLSCGAVGEAKATAAVDCNDVDGTSYPGAAEPVGDEVDHDCNSEIFCFVDGDGDTYGVASSVKSVDLDCGDLGESKVSTDCLDTNAAAHPGGAEAAGDGVDGDCNAQELCFVDGDGDKFGTGATVVSTDLVCTGTGESAVATDCNDLLAVVNPSATEIAGDDKDQNCDTKETCYTDVDNDDYGTTTVVSLNISCADANEGHFPLDCNDGNGAVNPVAVEVTANGVDDNCDTIEQCFKDVDGDKYGVATTVASPNLSCTDTGESAASTDCNDVLAAINPGVTETIGNDVDDNCDTKEICYVDQDNDDRGATTVISADANCNGANEGHQLGDCNDTVVTTYLNAPELCDKSDNDCDTVVDDGVAGTGAACAVTSCNALHTAFPSVITGTYYIQGGTMTSAVQMRCEMTAQGGGWTVMTNCLARNSFGGTLTTIVAGTSSGVDPQCRPYGQDAGGDHAYNYTFNFPPGYTQFTFNSYVAASHAQTGGGYVSDLGPAGRITSWALNPVSVTGDIAFGNPTLTGPTTSFDVYAAAAGYAPGATIPWPGPANTAYSVGPSATQFRIGFGEGGGEFEGWYPWWSGEIWFR